MVTAMVTVMVMEILNIKGHNVIVTIFK